jgi:hypothetical protein
MTKIINGQNAQNKAFISNDSQAGTAVLEAKQTTEEKGRSESVPMMKTTPTISRGEMSTLLPQGLGVSDQDAGAGNVSTDFRDYGIEDIQGYVNRSGQATLYLKEPEMAYQVWNQSLFKKHLKKSFKVPEDLAETFLLNALRSRAAYAGRVAGKQEGVYELNGQKILALDSYRVPEPAEMDWPTLRAVLEAALPDEDSQLRFMAWLYHAWDCLRQGQWLPLPALVLIGAKGTCKSLVLELIRYVLGDLPLGHALKYLSGRTRMNSDLVGSVVLAIDDEIANASKSRRVGIGQSIKKIAVTNSHRVEHKRADAITLDPHWRIIIASNDEMEDLQILPELNDSLRDKLLILHFRKGELPMPSRTLEERNAFWETLTREIPGFLHEMKSHPRLNDFGDGRMKVTGWQDAYVEAALLSVPEEERLLELIDAMPWWADKKERTLKANELHSILTGGESPVRHQARQLLNWDNAAGSLLGRLAKSRPERVQHAKPVRDRKWTITSPFVSGGEA